MKNSNDTIGNRPRDFLACSAVPQPTAPPRAPVKYTVNFISSVLRREDAHSDSLYCLLRVLPWHLSCN